MPERLWMATDKGGETYLYDRRPVPVRGEFLAKGDCWEVVFDDDNLPQPGEVWEYIRTDCIDTESGALAAATGRGQRRLCENCHAKTPCADQRSPRATGPGEWPVGCGPRCGIAMLVGSDQTCRL